MKPPQLLRRAEDTSSPFSALPAITELRRHLVELEYANIQAARRDGATWEEIARAIGITRQALYQRLRGRERRASGAR